MQRMSHIGMDKRKIEFRNRRVLIVGDVIFDNYIFGTVSRISPEAPVPVVKVTRRTEVLGGAANVAHNVIALGGQVQIIGLIGSDHDGTRMQNMMEEIGISTKLFPFLPYTITKTRVIGEHQQITRIDSETDDFVLADKEADKILNYIKEGLSEFDCVVISDYAKGFLTDYLTQSIIQLAVDRKKVSVVDPKGNDWTKYANASIITPNLKELSEAAGKRLKNEAEEIVPIAREILIKYQLGALLVTRSEQGMSFISNDLAHHAPTENLEVYDVSGAGDTVVSMVSLTASDDYSVEERLLLANKAAGIVVGKVGTATVTVDELLNTFSFEHDSPLLTRNELVQIVNREKAKGKRIVFTNGCFDILHRGHVSYLEKAKAQGDLLVLGLNSDASVQRLKGSNRPINGEDDRAYMLSKLTAVDFVTIFDEDTPEELIKLVEPDVLAKGADYKLEDVVGRQYAKEVALIDFVDGYSTSTIIKKSKEN